MKNIHHICLLALCFLLSACGAGNSASAGRDAIQQPAATGTTVLRNGSTSPAHLTSAPPVCPAQAFDTFLAAFANDVEVQKNFVTQPLQNESVDALAEPEPKPITKILNFVELHFPLMPSLQQQTHDGLKLIQTPSSNGEMEVKLIKPDTDYQLLFFFRNDGCWKLYRMRDDSL